jgi:hypothetical protein
MRIRPASSTISASIIPGLSLKAAMLLSPLVTLSTASRLHSGQSDRVRLGTPLAIETLSQLLGSGLSAQDGCGGLPFGKIELNFVAKCHAAFDSELMKLAGLADIGQNLLCGFARRREYRKLRHHWEACREVVGLFYPEVNRLRVIRSNILPRVTDQVPSSCPVRSCDKQQTASFQRAPRDCVWRIASVRVSGSLGRRRPPSVDHTQRRHLRTLDGLSAVHDTGSPTELRNNRKPRKRRTEWIGKLCPKVEETRSLLVRNRRHLEKKSASF